MSFFGYELLNYNIGDLWIFCYIIFGLWRGHGPKERVGWLVSFELFGPIQKFEGDQLLTPKYESSNILKFFKEMVEGRGGGRYGPLPLSGSVLAFNKNIPTGYEESILAHVTQLTFVHSLLAIAATPWWPHSGAAWCIERHKAKNELRSFIYLKVIF